MRKVIVFGIGILCLNINIIQLMAMKEDPSHRDVNLPISMLEFSSTIQSVDEKTEKLQMIHQIYCEAHKNIMEHLKIRSRILKLVRYFEVQPHGTNHIFPDSVLGILNNFLGILDRNSKFLEESEGAVLKIGVFFSKSVSELDPKNMIELCGRYKKDFCPLKELILKNYTESLAIFLSNLPLLHDLLLQKRDKYLKKAPHELACTIVHNTYRRAVGFLKILGESIGMKVDFEPKVRRTLSPSSSAISSST